ncbi:polysaccharide pyruvyl transferase family protein [Mesobacillus campisalis]|uniref:polysaccharide pyruvyl transferase family protein n=1 Tax=Mesobacillus campisalis TaxID=1408103 RepID=UPI00138F362C|nr:polysaccharide pyruvyl transferase family protein [Mesobacillus campisalis]
MGIIGSYGGSSIGDEAILKGLIETLEASALEINKVVIFSTNSLITKTAIGKLDYRFEIAFKDLTISRAGNLENSTRSKLTVKRNIIKFLKQYQSFFPLEKLYRKITKKPYIMNDVISGENLDALLFGGGNLLMDLYPKWPYIVEEILEQADKNRTKVYFIGMGAGPIRTPFGKRLFKKVVNKYYVSTRDQESAEYLRKQLKVEKSIKVGTDLAFGLGTHSDSNIRKNGLGITVVPYYADFYWPKSDLEKYQNYCLNMARILDAVLEELPEKVEFFATNYPFDLKVALEIKNLMKHGRKILVNQEKMDVDTLLEYLGKKKFILGTRLHSLILSSCRGTDFFGVSYQPKVRYFLNRLGKGHDCFNITELEQELPAVEIERLSSRIKESCQNRDDGKITTYSTDQKNGLIKELEQALAIRVAHAR